MHCNNVGTKEVNAVDALRDLVPFLQFKKHEKHLWSSDTFTNKITL